MILGIKDPIICWSLPCSRDSSDLGGDKRSYNMLDILWVMAANLALPRSENVWDTASFSELLNA